jgi:hypothetical protein
MIFTHPPSSFERRRMILEGIRYELPTLVRSIESGTDSEISIAYASSSGLVEATLNSPAADSILGAASRDAQALASKRVP